MGKKDEMLLAAGMNNVVQEVMVCSVGTAIVVVVVAMRRLMSVEWEASGEWGGGVVVDVVEHDGEDVMNGRKGLVLAMQFRRNCTVRYDVVRL